ncbi:Octanoate-[acyl-carrier-protein]-protein-N-octanoyltransferase [hydrothermal vent metagenome]|uniref:lipoyl(octanoyl) transferase n=1 Tax=hydrothermal vent metagenome TaxID=652676 RepID=A0A3B0T695_9ZZZZ
MHAHNAQIMVSEKLMISEKRIILRPNSQKRTDNTPVEWRVSPLQVPYPYALAQMKERIKKITAGDGAEQVWLLEHPPLYTAGTSARPEDLLGAAKLPVFDAGRGGQFTYHGPGQRVAYVMVDLKQRGRDIRSFVQHLEGWIIDTLATFDIKALQNDDRVGVWVNRPQKGKGRQDKIAAIGIRVSKWVSYHGISLNISPDLSHYQGIVPCGISDQGVTSFEDLGHKASMSEVDKALRRSFEDHFGPTIDV